RRFLRRSRTTGPVSGPLGTRSRIYRLRPGTLSMGRARDNAIVVGDPGASRHHAELRVGGDRIDIVDLGSTNGTFVDGERIVRAPVGQGGVIAIGRHSFQVDGDKMVEYIDPADVGLEADGLNVYADGGHLLHDVSFRLPGRALLGVVGPSGAGRPALLEALA